VIQDPDLCFQFLRSRGGDGACELESIALHFVAGDFAYQGGRPERPTRRRKKMPRLLSAAEVSELEKEFKSNAAAAPQDVKDVFCKLWPDARKAIEALLKIVTNPIAKLVLTIVEEIGDIAQKAMCPK
jgi:hypothetical protein